MYVLSWLHVIILTYKHHEIFTNINFADFIGILWAFKMGNTSTGGVSNLNDDKFESFINEHEFVLVKFYAPWCSGCKKIAVSYSQLALKLDSSNDIPVLISQIDCSINKLMMEKYEISKYPTIKFFHHGIEWDFTPKRIENNVEKWLKKVTEPKTKELKKMKEIEELNKLKLSAILYLYKKNPKLLNNFKVFASSHPRADFYFTYSDSVCDTICIQNHFFLILMRSFDEGEKIFQLEKSIEFSAINRFFEE